MDESPSSTTSGRSSEQLCVGRDRAVVAPVPASIAPRDGTRAMPAFRDPCAGGSLAHPGWAWRASHSPTWREGRDEGIGAGGRLRRPGADDEAVRGARRRRRRDAHRPGRGLRLRVLEAGRHVRTADGRTAVRASVPPTSSSPACASSRPRSARSTPTARRVETDAGAVRRRRAGRRPRRRSSPGGDARSARGRSRVLHGAGRVRSPRRARPTSTAAG